MTSTNLTGVITPEMIATQPVRFGVRSSRLTGNADAAMTFMQTLNARTATQGTSRTSTLTGQPTSAVDALTRSGTPSTGATTFASDLAGLVPLTGASATSSATTQTIANLPYGNLIVSAAQQYGVDPALVAAVIKQESGFDPSSESGVGAKGLMQLMDATAAGLGVTDSFDPAQNIDGGTRFLRDMLNWFGGDVSLALAAYNAGPYAVEQYGGIPPYEETQAYVPRVLSYYREFAGQA